MAIPSLVLTVGEIALNRLFALVWGAAALFIGYQAVWFASVAKTDPFGWGMVLLFGGIAAYFARSAWKDWKTPTDHRPGSDPKPKASRAAAPSRPADTPVPLEDQIRTLRDGGLVLAPGRTIDELLVSWPREDYEGDPYNLLLFMYGSEVEAAPWGRGFCERGWNFDMECLEQAGDYARAFEQIVRTTGQPQLVTDLTDDFHPDARAVEIRYAINGRRRVLKARVDNDWADPDAVTTFVKDVEAGIGDDRRFWASDNGQSSVLFFITEAEAAKINGVCAGILQRYIDT